MRFAYLITALFLTANSLRLGVKPLARTCFRLKSWSSPDQDENNNPPVFKNIFSEPNIFNALCSFLKKIVPEQLKNSIKSSQAVQKVIKKFEKWNKDFEYKSFQILTREDTTSLTLQQNYLTKYSQPVLATFIKDPILRQQFESFLEKASTSNDFLPLNSPNIKDSEYKPVKVATQKNHTSSLSNKNYSTEYGQPILSSLKKDEELGRMLCKNIKSIDDKNLYVLKLLMFATCEKALNALLLSIESSAKSIIYQQTISSRLLSTTLSGASMLLSISIFPLALQLQFSIYAWLFKKLSLTSLRQVMNDDELNFIKHLNNTKSESEMLKAEFIAKKIYLEKSVKKACVNSIYNPYTDKLKFQEPIILFLGSCLIQKVFELKKTPLILLAAISCSFAAGVLASTPKEKSNPIKKYTEQWTIVRFLSFIDYLDMQLKNTPLKKLKKIIIKEVCEDDEIKNIPTLQKAFKDLNSKEYQAQFYDDMLPLQKVVLYHERAKSWSSREQKLLEKSESLNAKLLSGLKLAAKEAKENKGGKTQLQLILQQDTVLKDFLLRKLQVALKDINRKIVSKEMKQNLKEEIEEAIDFVKEENALAGEMTAAKHDAIDNN